jgi:nitrite reductase/ring-hydroxylating ferredoxin subunit
MVLRESIEDACAEPRPAAAGLLHVGSIAELDREGRLFTCVAGSPILVLRAHDSLVAVDAACPHLGYSLEQATLVGRYVLECPIHHWRFDVRTGAQPRNWWTPPASRNSRRRLQRLVVEAIDGQIYVSPRG